MLIKNKQGIYESSLFISLGRRVIQGSTSRMHGDMKQRQNVASLHIPFSKFIFIQQVHGDRVIDVGRLIANSRKNADAMVCSLRTLKKSYSGQSYLLGILTADCVPIFFFDPQASVVGIAHAGWRGTILGISKKIIQEMVKRHASPSNIRVAFGPFIHQCCYSVPVERSESFSMMFKKEDGIVTEKNNIWSVHLGMANVRQLLSCGVLPEHIDSESICTSCNSNEFFSYRKRASENFGEIVNFIGFNQYDDIK